MAEQLTEKQEAMPIRARLQFFTECPACGYYTVRQRHDVERHPVGTVAGPETCHKCESTYPIINRHRYDIERTP